VRTSLHRDLRRQVEGQGKTAIQVITPRRRAEETEGIYLRADRPEEAVEEALVEEGNIEVNMRRSETLYFQAEATSKELRLSRSREIGRTCNVS